MFSPRFFTLACAATVWIGLSAAWQKRPFTSKQLREIGYDPSFEGPLPYFGDPYADPSVYLLDIALTTSGDANKSHVYLKYLTGSDPNNSQISRRNIREVRIRGSPEIGDLSLVENVFSKLERLDRVYWEYPDGIPASILQSIEKNNPSCQIYYKHRDYYSSHNPNDGSEAWKFTHSPNLYSLKAEVIYGGKDNFHDLEFIFNVLSTAPNLKMLDLHLHHAGCVYGGANPYAFDFKSHPSVRFPPLEVLRLDGYQLEERTDAGYEWYFKGFGWGRRWARGEKGDGRTSLDAWREAMDWSHLHTLDILGQTNITLNTLRYDMELPALRNLTISAGWREFTNEETISLATYPANPLEAISLKDFDVKVGEDLLDRFSSNPASISELKHFSFGARSTDIGFLPQEKISKFISNSPKLEKLDLAIPRHVNMSTKYEPFKSFISSPTIQHLTLRFPSADDYEYEIADGSTSQFDYSSMEVSWADMDTEKGNIPDPLINKETAQGLFKSLRTAKKGDELKRLDLIVGNWDGRHGHKEYLLGEGIRMRVALWRCWVVGLEGMERCEGE
ncbi:uncharacterized protein BP5553_02292 [Venustampulla echinocandica]|uniref:F-box domain-containing protein n=1 Tax=Venustampulla echinocandica TaxID=2656787 RepID=A0A370U3J0_9HELO|nr:uncharacterized protein BP5553_02292 [Venustampulla echinocandica]RDL42313.1 hypothetical protein BP5553_02292 [Venustampulla echinocandica]